MSAKQSTAAVQLKPKRVVILCGGPLGDAQYVTEATKDADIILCANGGLNHASNLMITPNFVVGDLDSADFSLIQTSKAQGTEIINYPAEKSKSDSELALEKALKLSPDKIEIFGAIGGRLDHTLGSISLLYKASKNVQVELIDTTFNPPCRIFLLSAGEKHFFKKEEKGLKFSLITLEPEGAAITIRGTEFNLNCKLILPSSRCLGNSVKEENALVMIHQGTVICMTGYDDQPIK